MADDDDRPSNGRWINFHNVISMGNILIILSMLGGALGVLVLITREVQAVIDENQMLHQEIVHETELRVEGERSVVNQIVALSTQETHDVESINRTLQDMRDDYRELLRVNAPAPPSARR
jgi:hypothetical protein